MQLGEDYLTRSQSDPSNAYAYPSDRLQVGVNSTGNGLVRE